MIKPKWLKLIRGNLLNENLYEMYIEFIKLWEIQKYFEGKKEDIQEKAILLIVDAGLLKESDIDENFL